MTKRLLAAIALAVAGAAAAHAAASTVQGRIVDADNQRPGPSSDDRTRVYATLGVSLGLLASAGVGLALPRIRKTG